MDGTFSDSLNVPTVDTFYGFKFNASDTGITNIVGGNIIVLSTLTFAEGGASGGNIEARGPVIVGANFDGGTSTLTFSGSSASGISIQTFDLSNGGAAQYDG